MTAVTTWTGWEANALRKALRMSVTDFAEHLGAARRTVAKWSSRGRDIELRTEMQAALDTVLARASSEVRERFEEFRAVGAGRVSVTHSEAVVVSDVESVVDTGEGGRGDLGRDGGVQRRDFLAETTVSGMAAISAVPRLLDALLSTGRSVVESPGSSSVKHLAGHVAAAKSDYQACRYQKVLGRLVTILPVFTATKPQVNLDEQARLDALATDLYHVVGSVLIKFGDRAMALVAAERSTQCGLASGDPVAVGTSARIMTHALMINGHTHRAAELAQTGAAALDRATRLGSADSVAVYGALLLRGAIAAARAEDRDTAGVMLAEAARAATRLGHDGNDRWTGFGPNNVQQHRANVALTLGDAGTAVALARQVQLDKLGLAERKASLFVDVAQAYTQWGRCEEGLSALRTAYGIAPEEVRSRPVVHRTVGDLAALSRGHTRRQVHDFVARVGIKL